MCQSVSLYRVKQIMSTHINIYMLIESVSMLYLCVIKHSSGRVSVREYAQVCISVCV